jgi:hypothetical protein
MYVQQIEGDSWRGSKFDKSKLDKMSGEHDNSPDLTHCKTDVGVDEQVAQLYELMQAIKKHEEENDDMGTSTKE